MGALACECRQDAVPGGMAMLVVDGLEVIDIKADDGEALGQLPPLLDHVGRQNLKSAAIQKAGQGIVPSFEARRFFIVHSRTDDHRNDRDHGAQGLKVLNGNGLQVQPPVHEDG